ncbi:hypothetical protein [Pseudonocardia spirodelae]|uniref:PASTA domain-containing protein n=1 Tax=Pseudonocardia spirodelae TaxID=3133431 RepID=A0ABU8TCR0_9PSEU
MRSPLSDYLDTVAPGGACPDHLVVPRSLAQSMPVRWQQVFVGLLADLHDAYPDVVWPEYDVSAVRAEPLTELDDDQLARHGYVTELGPDGELEYRDADDRVVPGSLPVRVAAPDTVPPASAGQVPRGTVVLS